MLENYSVEAQRIVSLAAMEARGLDHPRVGTEHLLLGLLSDEAGVSAGVLRGVGANLVTARHKVVEAVGADTGSPNGEALPFTARAQRALDRAARFSRKDGEAEVTAGHVLLGVLDVEGLACQVLRGLGVDIVHLRHAVAVAPDAVAVFRTDVALELDDEQPSVAVVRPRCPHCRALLDDTLAATMVPARRDDESTTNVTVVYCTACGASLGVMRQES